jgi:DNA processing protein
LVEDPEPPGVLFWIGDLEALARPCVAIVGTRQCTGYGREVAHRLGHDLAESGVCVISGLALGIDGAVHQGVLAAPGGAGPVGVAASGPDVPYPPRHRDLWRQVAKAGAIISETAPGQPAQAWRFPARNRIIAALSQAVVVVESHTAGGSMLTVTAAAERGIDVLAVPGPITSPASAGTNQLLHEGLAPVRHAGDVLAALGDFRPWPPHQMRPNLPSSPPKSPMPAAPTPQRATHPPEPPRRETPPPAPPPETPAPETAGSVKPSPPGAPSPGSGRPGGRPTRPGRSRVHLEPPERRVLDSVDRTPTATSAIAHRTGLPIGPLSTVLLHLETLGLVRGEGLWWERCDGQ